MARGDFLRMFKGNEEAWKTMLKMAGEKETKLFDRCYSFVSIVNEEKKVKNVRNTLPDEIEVDTRGLILDKIKQDYTPI